MLDAQGQQEEEMEYQAGQDDEQPQAPQPRRSGQEAGQQQQDPAQDDEGPEEDGGDDADGSHAPVNDQQGQVGSG